MKHIYHRFLQVVQSLDLRETRRKDESYNASWKARGGVGAFMMLARKWDRIEPMAAGVKYDIFAKIADQAGPHQGDDGTLIAEIRDLRRYLLLVEAWAIDQGWVQAETPSQADIVHVFAAALGIEYTDARARLLNWAHGVDTYRPVAPPAQGRLDVVSEPLELSPRAAEGSAGGTVAADGSSGLDEPLNVPNYALAEDDEKPQMPVLELSHQRQPRCATAAEYEAIKHQTVPAGSMKDLFWIVLYKAEPNADGRWDMLSIHHEEYGN